MKITISDACIFLDLLSLGLIEEFFELNMECHVPFEIINELGPHEKKEIENYCSLGAIHIHYCDQNDWKSISAKGYPNTIALNDKISLHVSDKLNTLLLSTDSLVREIAKKKSIEYHGILWIFDKLLEAEKIDKKHAVVLLTQLMKTNRFYRQNSEFATELQKRAVEWKATIPTIS